MDWAQMIATLATGAAGLLTVQKLIANLKKEAPTKPLVNGERRDIIAHLARLEQIGLNHERAAERINGRLDDMDDRLRQVERICARLTGRTASTTGSTD